MPEVLRREKLAVNPPWRSNLSRCAAAPQDPQRPLLGAWAAGRRA